MDEENYLPFAERHGYVRKALQIESMNTDLRNSLWNVFTRCIWGQSDIYRKGESLKTFIDDMWVDHFKYTIDSLRDVVPHRNDSLSYGVIRDRIRKRVFKTDWFGVYNFLEYVAVYYPNEATRRYFMQECNDILRRERAAYRFVSGLIAPITNEIEIETIESAAMREGPVAIQIRGALEKLSDRENADYRNAFKDAISAVESHARRVMKSDKTLGKLLSVMEQERGLPMRLKTAFSELFKYASGPSGARHGGTKVEEMEKVDFDFAKLMLVTCSAFINYLSTLEQQDDEEK